MALCLHAMRTALSVLVDASTNPNADREFRAQTFERNDNSHRFSNRIIGANVIVQMFREQRASLAILTFDKALHLAPVVMRYWLNLYRAGFVYTPLRFYTASAMKSRFQNINPSHDQT